MASLLDILRQARTATIVGASDRTALQRVAIENLIASGVAVTGVNPGRAHAGPVECYPSFDALPATPEVALVLVSDDRVLDAVAGAIAAGARLIVVPGLDASPANRPVRDRIADRVAAAGATLIGPDCMGVLQPDGLRAWIGTLPPTLRAGGLGIASQSGAVAEALIALGPRLGFRTIVSVGTEGGVDLAGACDLFADDPGVRAAGLFVEATRRPAALRSALGRLADAGKPAVVLHVGESPAAAAAAWAHSGAVTSDAGAVAALVRSAGAILTRDFADFVETLAVLDSGRWPRGTRLAAVTNSGGEAALLADEGHRAGLPFEPLAPGLDAAVRAALDADKPVSNPVDAWSAADPHGGFGRTLAALAGSGRFDILLAQIDQAEDLGEMEREWAARLSRALVDSVAGTETVAAVVNGLAGPPVDAVADSGALVLRGAGPALRALAGVARWEPRRPRARPPAPAARTATGGVGELLERHGFSALDGRRPDGRWATIEMRVCHDADLGPYIGLRGTGGAASWALLPLARALTPGMVRDAGLVSLPPAFAAAVGERLTALAELAVRELGDGSLHLVLGLVDAGPVVLSAHRGQA